MLLVAVETKSKIDEAVEWYTANFDLYEELAYTVETTVNSILKDEKVLFHSVSSRTKDIKGYREKASKEKYKDPKKEIMDMAGIRVITYLDSDALKVRDIIKKSFHVIPEHSVDKSKALGTDRVGYRSIHCICTLGEKRCELPENKKFSDLLFEIQIRTILQHAWAEFEHDRNYKFKGEGVLPKRIRRKLAIVAGNLELLDSTFQSLAESINNYTNGVQKKTDEGDLSVKITSAALNVYLRKKLSDLIGHGLNPTIFNDKKLISELTIMDINSLEDLDEIIPEDYVVKCIELGCTQQTFNGVLIDLMIILNAELYFTKAWNSSWFDLSPESVNILKFYKVDIDKYIEKFGLDINNYEADFEPDFEPPEYEPDYEPPNEEPPEEYFEEEPEYEPEPPDEEPPQEYFEAEPDYEEPEPPEERALPEEYLGEEPQDEPEPPEEEPPEHEPEEPPEYEPTEDPSEQEPPDYEPEGNLDEEPH